MPRPTAVYNHPRPTAVYEHYSNYKFKFELMKETETMARRHGRLTTRPAATAFGTDNYYAMDRKINMLMHKTINVMCPFKMTGTALLSNLFKEDTLDLMRAAYKATDGDVMDTLHRYSIAYDMPNKKRLSFLRMGEQYNLIPPREELLAPTPEIEARLAEWCRGAMEIIMRFNELRHVVAWMNQNLTLGAVRYYMPTVVALLPPNQIPELLEGVPKTFKNNPEITPLLPVIRDAMGTIASAKLLPNDADPDKSAVTVSFPTAQHYAHGVVITSEQTHVRLIGEKDVG